MSIFCAFYFVSAQSSVLKILRRTDSEIFLEHSAFLILLNAAQVNCFLLLMFSDVPSTLPVFAVFPPLF